MKITYISNEEDNQSFARRAAEHFAENPKHWTYTDGDIVAGCMFAMRYGLGNDCVVIFKISHDADVINYQELIRSYNPVVDAEFAKPKETEEQKLLSLPDECHDYNSFLWFELGYTRPTGWMVHITDKQGGGENKIVCTQSEDREEACEEAALILKECFMEVLS